MYCPNCGKQLPDKTAICTYCGVPTGEQAAAPAPAKVNKKQPKSEPQAKPKKESNTPVGMGIAGFIVSLIAVVGTLSPILSLIVRIMENRPTIFFSGIFLMPIVGFVLSLVGWYSGKRDENADTYRNPYALVGNVLGGISLVLATVYCLFSFFCSAI